MNIEEILSESRRNPSLNIKRTTVEELEKYKGRKDIFVHFSKLPLKLGVNTKSKFETPIGVYAYPISFILDGVEDGYLPATFAVDRPYIHVLRARGNNLLNLNQVTKAFIPETVEKIKTLYPSLSDSNIQSALAKANRDASIPAKIWWFFTHNIAYMVKGGSKPLISWNKVLRRLGYDGIIDTGHGIIHPSEPAQTVFLSARGYQQIDVIENTARVAPTAYQETPLDLLNIANIVSDSAKVYFTKNPDILNNIRFVDCKIDFDHILDRLHVKDGHIRGNKNVLSNPYLSGVKVQDVVLVGGELHDTAIFTSKLSGNVSAHNSNIIHCQAEDLDMDGGSVSDESIVRKSKLTDTRIKSSFVFDSTIVNCESSGARFVTCDISGGSATGGMMQKCNLTRVTGDDLKIDESSTVDCNISNSIFRYSKSNIRLSGTNNDGAETPPFDLSDEFNKLINSST